MQHVSLLGGEARDLDPWWTLLVFFNSLRELGGAATLFTADTREYLKVILNRHGVEYSRIRQLFHVEELTSRIRGDHIPRLLERLEVPMSIREGTGTPIPNPAPIDACLASNIIEVGVDIPRLSLMAIVGQPRTTSQYIQVSSRIGRDWTSPGSSWSSTARRSRETGATTKDFALTTSACMHRLNQPVSRRSARRLSIDPFMV